MAENEQGAQPDEQAEGAPNGAENAEPEKDWKAEYERLLKHSRSWEDKAKRLKDKADRFDELEEASKSDAEKLADATKRAEDAEARLAEYERRAERDATVAEVAAARGVDAEWLSRMSGGTREEIEANADFIAGKLNEVPMFDYQSECNYSKIRYGASAAPPIAMKKAARGGPFGVPSCSAVSRRDARSCPPHRAGR